MTVRPLATEQLRELAREFLAANGAREPWTELLTSWARDRGLTDDQAHDLKVAVLRERVFHSVERGAAGAKRRRKA
jgi:hypothetical protein